MSGLPVGTRSRKLPLYLVTAGALFAAGIVFGLRGNPYGTPFFPVAIPGLVLFNSLQWLAISIRGIWRATGMLGSILAAFGMMLLYAKLDFGTFAAVFILALGAQAVLLWLVSSEWAERSIVLVEHVSVAFVVLVGLDLNLRGVAAHLDASPGTTADFLFWAPLLAVLLWAGGVAFRKDKAAQLVLICVIAQIGMGLLDLGTIWHISWALPASVVAVFAALGIAVCLVKAWQVRAQS